MSPLLSLILGLVPSLIWLCFYLRKDVHPEPKGIIVQVFFLGMLSSILAAVLESIPTLFFVSQKISLGFLPQTLTRIFSSRQGKFLFSFSGIALIEESLKYLVVKIRVLKDSEFDEPLDAMIYMITAALGFAALENILIFLSPKVFFLSTTESLSLAGWRFAFATFLHALCSGIIGYFLGLLFFKTRKRTGLILFGLGLATLLHGLYNFSIMVIGQGLNLIIPVFILVSLSFAISRGFRELQKANIYPPPLPSTSRKQRSKIK